MPPESVHQSLADSLRKNLEGLGELSIPGDSARTGIDLAFRNPQTGTTLFIEAKNGSGEATLPLGSLSALQEWRNEVREGQPNAELIIITESEPPEPLLNFLDELSLTHLSVGDDMDGLIQKLLELKVKSSPEDDQPGRASL